MTPMEPLVCRGGGSMRTWFSSAGGMASGGAGRGSVGAGISGHCRSSPLQICCGIGCVREWCSSAGGAASVGAGCSSGGAGISGHCRSSPSFGVFGRRCWWALPVNFSTPTDCGSSGRNWLCCGVAGRAVASVVSAGFRVVNFTAGSVLGGGFCFFQVADVLDSCLSDRGCHQGPVPPVDRLLFFAVPVLVDVWIRR